MIGILSLMIITVVIPQIFGLKAYGVMANSMEPKYPMGSLIYVKSVSADKLHIGDDITFKQDNSLLISTRRIVDISDNGEYFTTMNISNNTKDNKQIYYMNIIGTPKIAIPFLGYVVQYFNTNYGRLLGIGIIVLLMALSLFPKKKFKKHIKGNAKIIKGDFASEI